MINNLDDSTLLEWIYKHTRLLEETLTPASRLIWIALLTLSFSKSKTFVEGSVKNICHQLSLCDKTFKKGIDELQKKSLLTLHNIQTDLGAHSFRYTTKFPPATSPRKNETTYINFRNVLLSKKHFDTERVTVNQRMLMIAVLAITDGYSLITQLHVEKLSQLTGIPNRNILSNLEKLEAKGLLALLVSHRPKKTDKKARWAYQLTYFTKTSNVKCVFDRNIHSEVKMVSLLLRRKEIEEQLKVPKPGHFNKWARKQFRMSGVDVEYYLYFAFSGAPKEIYNSLFKAIESCQVMWEKLNNKGLLVYVDWLLQQAAIQTLQYQFKRSISDMYSNCPHTESLIKAQVHYFPLTDEQKKILEQVLAPLSKMVATAMKNEINAVNTAFPEVRLGQCQILVESYKQRLANSKGKSNPSLKDVYTLKYEPIYTTKKLHATPKEY